MQLGKDNLEVFAARNYTNEVCESRDEFYEDLERYRLARKLARKIGMGKSDNIRLLCNHILCFTNNFKLDAAKEILVFDATTTERTVIKTVLNYLGFITKAEMSHIPFSIPTARLLKDMDKGK